MNDTPFDTCIRNFYFHRMRNYSSQSFMVEVNNLSPDALSAFMECDVGVDDHRYSLKLLTFGLNGVAGIVVSIFGLLGNLMSMVVLTRKSMANSSTYCYLTALAVCDFFFVLCSFILLGKDAQMPTNDASTWQGSSLPVYYSYLFPYLHPAAFTLQVASAWLTIAFTVDRYVMICHPFSAECYCTVAKARRVIIAVVVTCVAFNLPKFFEYRTVIINSPFLSQTSSTTVVGVDLTHVGKNRIFLQLYHSWFYAVFVSGIPFATLFVLNSFLVRAVRLSRRRGLELNSSEQKRTDTTVMLIGVVVIFFVCQLPALVSRVIYAYEDDQEAWSRMPLFALNETANFLILLNSSVNIIPYYFFGKRFRKQFRGLFCRKHSYYELNFPLGPWSATTASRKPSTSTNNCYRLDID